MCKKHIAINCSITQLRLKTALDVGGMENLVSLVASGLSKVLIVYSLNHAVIMGLTEVHVLVCVVENSSTYSTEVYSVTNRCGLEGLSTAVYTTAGASHDLDKLVLLFAALNSTEKLFRVLGAACNSNSDGLVAKLVGSTLNAFCSAYVFEIKLLEGLAEDNLSSSTESSLHNTAGSSEDNACAGTNREGIVELLVCKSLEVDTAGLNKSAKLSGSNSNVNVGYARSVLVSSANLKLLSGAGDSGYKYDILGIKTVLFSIIGLVNSTKHLLGRLAGRKVVCHLGEVVLAILDPSGAARGHKRELAAVLDAVKKLCSLFKNCKVSGEVHVVYAVKAESLESSNHLAFHVCAGFVAEAFADCCTNGRSAADSNVLCGIADCVEDLLGVVLFVDRADGAGNNALTAVDAGCFSEVLFERAADLGVVTAVYSADGTDALELVAGSNAAAAEDTLVVVTNEGNGGLVKRDGDLLVGVGEAVFVSVVVLGQLLEFAAGGTDAGETFLFVSGENQLDVGLSCSSDLGGVGLDFHAFGDGVNAGSNHAAGAGYFNKAETASADFIDVLEVAEGRDVDVCISAGFENGDARGYGIFDTVYFNIYHIHNR